MSVCRGLAWNRCQTDWVPRPAKTRTISRMKISAKDEYACSAVLELALHYEGESPIRVQDIAERHGIPIKFLFQIMQILKRVDIVRSKRGTEGGYVLTRHPSQITVGEVIRSMSGPFVQLSCLE